MKTFIRKYFLLSFFSFLIYSSPSLSSFSAWVIPNETRTHLTLVLYQENQLVSTLELQTAVPDVLGSEDTIHGEAFMEKLKSDLPLFIDITNFLIHFYAYEVLLDLIFDLDNAEPSYLLRINILNVLNKCLALLSEFEDIDEVTSLRSRYYALFQRLQFENSTLIRQAEAYYKRKKFTDALLTLSHVNLSKALMHEFETYHRIRLLIFIERGNNMHALHEAGLILTQRASFAQPTLWVAKVVRYKYADLNAQQRRNLLQELSHEARTSAQHLKIAHIFEKNGNHKLALHHYLKALDTLRSLFLPIQPFSPLTKTMILALRNGLFLLIHESHTYSEQEMVVLHQTMRSLFNQSNYTVKTAEDSRNFKHLYKSYLKHYTDHSFND